MRVLWVTNLWPDEQRPWHGTFVFSQAQSLRRAGVEIDVLGIRGYSSRLEYLRAIARQRHMTAASDYDLVHAHYGHSAIVASMQKRLPLVISYCGSDLLGSTLETSDSSVHYENGRPNIDDRLAWVFSKLAHAADATITKSNLMASRLPDSCRARNTVIPNGVDLEFFAPIDALQARSRLGWRNDVLNVLFVGNPDELRKNCAFARSVCSELAARGRPAELRIAYGLSPSEVVQYMGAADCLLFPSLQEGSPNTVKEAMAMELPVVATAVGDIEDRLREVSCGRIITLDVAEAATAVEQVTAGGDRCPQARMAVAPLELGAVADRVIQVYNRVLRSPADTSPSDCDVNVTPMDGDRTSRRSHRTALVGRLEL